MRLVLRQTQRLVMTPLLQQAIQLLQLSTLELQEMIDQELRENPMLEESNAEGPEAQAEAATVGEAAAAVGVTEPPAQENPEQQVDGQKVDELPFDLNSAMFDDPGDERTPVSTEDRDELPFENLGKSDRSLEEHLTEDRKSVV